MDLISRQDAIEHYRVTDPAGTFAYCNSIIEFLESLPSAQPEQRWIPCSERLPEDNDYKPFSYYEDGAILYCTENGKVGFGWYYESIKQWANEDDGDPGNVIAWMPLPEPYAERQEE